MKIPEEKEVSDLFLFVVGSCDKEEAFSEVKRNMVLEEVSRGEEEQD